MAKVGKQSALKMSIYANCPRQYRFQYIDHVEVPRNIRIVFGTAIHYIIELFYKRKFKTREKFQNYWSYYWWGLINGDFGRKVEIAVSEPLKRGFIYAAFNRIGKQILGDYYDKNIETRMKSPPLSVEKTFNIEFEGHKLTGRWDTINLTDVGYEIINFKTDKRLPSSDSIVVRKGHQSTFYSLAFRKVFREVESGIGLYHLRSGNIIPTERNRADYEYLLRCLDETREKIEDDYFEPFFDYRCNWCDWNRVCLDEEISKKYVRRISYDEDEPDFVWGLDDGLDIPRM